MHIAACMGAQQGHGQKGQPKQTGICSLDRFVPCLRARRTVERRHLWSSTLPSSLGLDKRDHPWPDASRSAYAAHLARRAADFGVTISGQIVVDMKAVKARKNAVSGKSKVGLETYLNSLKGYTVYEDRPDFFPPGRWR
jgi:hypothetical protein